MVQMNETLKKAVIIGGMLTFGTATVVTQKLLFGMSGEGRDSKVHLFEKPWFQTEAMFIGMAGCLVVYEILRCIRNSKARKDSETMPLMGGSGSVQDDHDTGSRLKQYLVVIAPACCDMCATAAMNVGLLWISASVWQMLRGSMVIFSALFSKFFLKRELFLFHWIGVGTVVFALCVVALSALMQDADVAGSSSDTASASSSQEAIGIVLVVGAQVIQASQIVIEEHLLKGISIDPVLIVGLEGLWGGIVCSLLLVVVAYIPGSLQEDTIDTFIMLGKNPGILATVIFYSCVILGYNLFGMLVTNVTTAVIRTILEAVRTACVWVVNLFIFYAINGGKGDFGEKWTDWSYLQLCGFIFLLCGLFIYNGILRINGIYYPDQEKKERDAEDSQA